MRARGRADEGESNKNENDKAEYNTTSSRVAFYTNVIGYAIWWEGRVDRL